VALPLDADRRVCHGRLFPSGPIRASKQVRVVVFCEHGGQHGLHKTQKNEKGAPMKKRSGQ
jgi:hypothetical protein